MRLFNHFFIGVLFRLVWMGSTAQKTREPIYERTLVLASRPFFASRLCLVLVVWIGGLGFEPWFLVKPNGEGGPRKHQFRS